MAMIICRSMLKDNDEQKQARLIYNCFIDVNWLDFDGCILLKLLVVVFAEILCCYAAEVLI